MKNGRVRAFWVARCGIQGSTQAHLCIFFNAGCAAFAIRCFVPRERLRFILRGRASLKQRFLFFCSATAPDPTRPPMMKNGRVRAFRVARCGIPGSTKGHLCIFLAQRARPLRFGFYVPPEPSRLILRGQASLKRRFFFSALQPLRIPRDHQ